MHCYVAHSNTVLKNFAEVFVKMEKYKLRLRYIYTFYSFDEILLEDAFDSFVELDDAPLRFKLEHQEDATFIISEPRCDATGVFAVLTFPSKDNIIVREGEECELEYDEFFDAMGDNNHNVYEGTLTLCRD